MIATAVPTNSYEKIRRERWIIVSDLYHVSSSPHARDKDTTSRIMLYVIIALLPTSLFGIYNFGLKALLLILVTIASCVASEWIYNKIVHKKNTITDLSAVVTGLLLALNLPVNLPWWEAVIGGVFAIIVVKCLFGGLGQNFMNPALGARCFLLIAFAADMTNFVTDTYTGATPLAAMRNGEAVNTMNMLIGRTSGTLGETSTIAILIGAIFLILMGVIDLRIPASYIITFAVFMLIFGGHGFDVSYLTAQLCGGGLMLGAFFMATDYVTSPITPRGQIIFGICCGIFTGLFRCFGANAEGVSFAIILSNLLVPMIEKVTVPRAFGIVKEAKKQEGGK
jgi:Na+-translocating ferredoxin:NAD+ oxidoreductase RnfD subunit